MDEELNHNLSGVSTFYDQKSEYEWQRLERHRMEYELTLRAILAHLPPAPARVLDCGGGPGRYAIELTRRGYQVTLFDLSSVNLKTALAHASAAGVNLAGFEQGTATDLSRFEVGTFDAVLLLGPLYHLFAEADRRLALTEVNRVLKPGGYLFAAFIGRYAAHRWLARNDPEALAADQDINASLLETGVLPPRAGGEKFTGYFAHPNEIAPLVWESGFELEAVLGLEGLLAGFDEDLNQLLPEAWEAWVELSARISADTCLQGAVDHLLAVAIKPRWRAVLAAVVQEMEKAGATFKVVGGAALALHGLPVQVKDVDLETNAEGAYQFQELYESQMIQMVGPREGQGYRSHFGRFLVGGVELEVMGDLQRWQGEAWVPTYSLTEKLVDLGEQVFVRVSWLEEETLAYLRRGRLERAALCLPRCEPARLMALLRGEVKTNVI